MSAGAITGIVTPLTAEQAKLVNERHEYSEDSAEMTDESDASWCDEDEEDEEDGAEDEKDEEMKTEEGEEEEEEEEDEIVKHDKFYFDDGNLFILVSSGLESPLAAKSHKG